MKQILLLVALVFSQVSFAQSPWYFGSGEAVNLTNGTAFKNGVKNISGALNPSVVAVNAPAGSMYYSTSGTVYVKQDAGLSVNWFPLGVAAPGTLTSINGQSGPAVILAAGTAGTDFAISAATNTITFDIPSASGSARGLLTSANWTTFNDKEPAITATTSADYYRGDKTFATLNKTAVGLANVDNTSDANKPVSTATQTALDLKVTGAASSTADAIMTFSGTTGKLTQNGVGTLTTAGVMSNLTQFNVDNFRLDGNVFSSTNTDGAITLTPNGTGTIGFGSTPSANYFFDISGPTNDKQALRGTTLTASTGSVIGAATLRARSSGQMTNGFGPGLSLSAMDADGVDATFAVISATRSGADNTAGLNFATRNAGSGFTALTLSPTGVANLPQLTASLPVKTNSSKDLVSAAIDLTSSTEVTGALPINRGGTNSATALSGSSIMVSNGTSVIQGSAGTATTLLHGNASGVPTYSAASLTADVTGVLPTANGGTNKALTTTLGGLVTTDADSMEVLAPGTAGQILQTNGAATHTYVNKSISGKSENNTAVTMEELQVPNNQLTLTASGKYLYNNCGGGNNLLADCGFEKSTLDTAWVTTGTTATISSNSTTTYISNGSKSLKLAATSQVFTIVQDSSLFAAGWSAGTQGVILLDLWSTHNADITICARAAAATLTTGCYTVTAAQRNGGVNTIAIPVILGATSNGISISGASGTGDTYIDNVRVEQNTLSSNVGIIGPQTAYTPTFTGYGTVSTSNITYQQIGTNVIFSGTFASGTATATEGRISFPNSWTTPSTIPTLSVAGHWSPSVSQASHGGNVLIEPSVGYMTFSDRGTYGSTGVNGLGKANGDATVSAGAQTMSIFAIVPISQLVGTANIFKSTCGAECVDTLTARSSTVPALSNLNVSGWVTSVANSGTNNQTKTFTVPSGIFTVTPNCTCTANETSASSADKTCFQDTALSTTTSLVFYTTSSATATNMAMTISCGKAGADFTASRQISGSFKEVITAPGITKPKSCLYAFGGAASTLASPVECTTGTCVEVTDTCATVTAPTRAAAGQYDDIVFASGTFANSTALNCDCEAYDTAFSHRVCTMRSVSGEHTWSSNSSGGATLNTQTFTAAGVDNDTYVIVKCEGSAP